MSARFRAPLILGLTALALVALFSTGLRRARALTAAPARDSSSVLPVAVGDSADIFFTTSGPGAVDIACVNCAPSLTYTRPEPHLLRVFAKGTPTDTLHRSVCFTEHGTYADDLATECVSVKVTPEPSAVYSVPVAIRLAERVALHPVPVATYDQTGQSSHPDVLRISVPWSAHPCWMVFTPYAGSSRDLENPSLASSPDCEHWIPAQGVKAPLIDKPGEGYNSDPDLLFDAVRGCLGVMFRQVTTVNTILLTASCNGTSWSPPRALFSVPNHGAISPAVAVGPDGRNRVWYVRSTENGCGERTSVMMRAGSPSSTPLDRIEFGKEVPTDLEQPGWVIWHLNVEYVPEKGEYWAMYAAYSESDNGGCLNDDLFFATSADGTHWKSYPVPILDHLDKRFEFRSLYRASFVYEAATDRVRTIVSAKDSVWGQFAVVHDYPALRHALDTSRALGPASLVSPPSLVRRAPESRRRVVLNANP